ncbi:hypothetical protein [Propionicimonas sp.]|uniref:hypothetical protein n=1 Tax=Propionicimonas sp. TaxID=1955623 RepID=UPI0039E5C711
MLLAVLAGLAASLSVVAAWTHTLVSDTDTFVATYSPLVRSPAVQQELTGRLTDAVIAQLGVGDNRLTRTLVTRVVSEAAGSEAFATATTASLRLAHAELAAQLRGDPGRLEITEGVIQLPYAPFVDAITQRLTDAGVPFLDRLPTVTGGFTLLRIDPAILPAAQTGYRALAAVAGGLPWLALALAVAAAWVWPGARGPLAGLGLSLLGWVLLVGLAWRLAMQGLIHGLGDGLGTVAGTVASLTSAPVASPLLAIGVAGGLLAFLAALSLPTSRAV